MDDRAHSRGSNGEYRIHYRTETLGVVHRSTNETFQRSPLHARVPSTPQRNKPRPRSVIGEEPLASLSLEVQEALIIEDLLSVLMGIEGAYISVHPDYVPDDPRMQLKGARFVAAPHLDPSLRDFVSRILPLATYFTAISSFIELRGPLEYGLVNHALCAALREQLKDYYILLAQLENAFNSSNSFSLQKLWFYVHPTLHKLSLMYGLISELAEADDEAAHSSEGSDSDPDGDDDDALGISSGVKAVLSQLDGVGGGGIIKGGEVVAVLWQRMAHMAGDPSARTLYSLLMRTAARPYVEALQKWITAGQLEDPYGELMVKEAKFIQRSTLDKDFVDEYWERRYTLRDGSTLSGAVKRQQAGVPSPRKPGGRLPGGACIPPPLESWKHKILLAGKYLNVIRECGMEVTTKAPSAQQLAIDEEGFYKSVELAYTHANTTLLKLLLDDQQLVLRLRTMRHFFFLCQSSFLTQFLDLASSELRKSARSANLTKLQSLLDLALKDDGNPDLCREDIKVSMSTSGLYEWLLKVVSVSGALDGGADGGGSAWDAHAMDIADDTTTKDKEREKDKKPLVAIDALTLDFAVKFPLSLVLSKKTILRYQLLFRFLLHLKHVEMALSAMWTEHTQPVWRSKASQVPEDLERWRRRVFLLRARMLAFVQQLLAFATSEVLEPHWRALEAKLAKVQTVDQLLRDHVDFLDTCLKECMLTSSKLLKAYSKLVVTCSTFAVYTASFTKSAAQAVSEPEVTPMEKRWEFLSKFETNFNHWLKTFIDCVSFYSSTDNIQLLALVVRLNSVQTGAS